MADSDRGPIRSMKEPMSSATVTGPPARQSEAHAIPQNAQYSELRSSPSTEIGPHIVPNDPIFARGPSLQTPVVLFARACADVPSCSITAFQPVCTHLRFPARTPRSTSHARAHRTHCPQTTSSQAHIHRTPKGPIRGPACHDTEYHISRSRGPTADTLVRARSSPEMRQRVSTEAEARNLPLEARRHAAASL